MITVGTRSCIGNQLYEYQEAAASRSRNRTAAAADNQTFAARLLQAMDRKEENTGTQAAETQANPKAQAAETAPSLSPDAYMDAGLDGAAEGTVLSYILKMREHMRDISSRVMSGSAEPSFQIGSSTFTEREWEEFLSRFDSVEEAVQAAMRAEYEEEDAVNTNAAGTSIANDQKKAQAVLDPAVSVTRPFSADTARQAFPVNTVSFDQKMRQEESQFNKEQEEFYSPYFQTFWKGRV